MILMKFVSKVVIFNKIKKPGGPPKEHHGPLEGRGPPFEKHLLGGLVNRFVDSSVKLANSRHQFK